MKRLNVPAIEGISEMDFPTLSETMTLKAATDAVDTVNWPDAFPFAPNCRFYIARDNKALVVLFKVEGPDLVAKAIKDGEPTWQDSCCEFFIAPSDKGYYNFEMNCIGTILSAFGPDRNDRTPLTDEQFSRIKRFASLPHEAINKEGGNEQWSVAAVIPFDLIGLDCNNLPKSVRANFYKCGDQTPHVHYVSWNPIDFPTPNFHLSSFFGELRF